MRTLTYQLRDLKKVTIEIGFEGENNRTQVRIDCGDVFAEYPNAEAALKVQAPKGGIYPATVTRDGNMILWTVRDCDVANKGNGEFQLTFTDGETVVKTCPGKIHIDRSLKGSGTAPSGVQDWLERAEEVLEGVEAAEIHQPMIGLDGYWYKWDQENGEYVSTGTKAQGQNGVGIASIVKTGTVGLVDTYTITFTNGTTTTYTVTNGEGGTVIDDTTPATDKVFSSSKVNTELGGVKNALTAKADKEDTVLDTTLSRGRLDDSDIGEGSFAFGDGVTASGVFAFASGRSTASGDYSYAEGYNTTASGDGSHAEGDGTTASGGTSHAEGSNTTASEDFSHAEGSSTTASGQQSHAEGYYTEASGTSTHAEGEYTEATGYASHAEGSYTDADGNYSHAEGYYTQAEGEISHAEGNMTIAGGYVAHAEGIGTVADGGASHVVGAYNVGDSSDNIDTWVAGTSYAIGDKVIKTYNGSPFIFQCKTANSDSSFDISKWYDLNFRWNFAEIVGNGIDENNKSNARTLDWDGNERLKGDLFVHANADGTGGKKVATTEEIPTAASNAQIKAGTNTYNQITASKQHISAFFALAKAAGADMAELSNLTMGVYPDAQKIAIQKMLGIYESPWELIREDTVTNATEADVDITVDGDGESFELTDVYLQVWTPQQETDASIGDYGQVRSYYDSSNYITSQMNTWSQAANAAARYGQVLLENKNGAILNTVTQNATQYSSVGLIGRTNILNNDALLKIGTFAFDKIVIKKVTGTVNYKLYGKRKWN